jgi:hypothetical protein
VRKAEDATISIYFGNLLKNSIARFASRFPYNVKLHIQKTSYCVWGSPWGGVCNEHDPEDHRIFAVSIEEPEGDQGNEVGRHHVDPSARKSKEDPVF